MNNNLICILFRFWRISIIENVILEAMTLTEHTKSETDILPLSSKQKLYNHKRKHDNSIIIKQDD